MRLPAVLAVLLGALLGLSAYTFRYAEGVSYLSDDPRACANCHVMREYLDSWQKSSHHARATCNDCHVPHALAPKYVAKSENGWRHSVRFTLQDYPEQLRITARNAAHLQHNCVDCHAEFANDIRLEARGGQDDEVRCARCHAAVGHGPRR
jgi:cytochrome c nitrite reductase small subunit